MIFQRAAQREFTHTAAGVFVALIAIIVTTQLIRILGQAAGGKISAEAVLPLVGFGALGFMPVALSLTLFISVLLPISRTYRDSEMVVWQASGVALTRWLAPVTRFALPLTAAIAILSLFLTPWALGQSLEYRNRLDSRGDAARVAPGSFQESVGADRVFFVEAVADDASHVRNVFVNARENGRESVVVAARGTTETQANGDRFLVLENGRRYETEPNTLAYRVGEFLRYAVRIESKEQRQFEDKPKNMSTWALLNLPSPVARAELLWRLGLPVSAFLLTFLAIPLAFVNPRAGRAGNFLLALLIYMIYNNLLGITQAWVAQEKLGFGLGASIIHLLMGAILILLFIQRTRFPDRWWRWR